MSAVEERYRGKKLGIRSRQKRGKGSQLSRNGRQEYSRREEEQRTDTVYSELEQM